jgi:protein-L-isoaspartate(D-aspartate) O-methyltransferase
METQRKKLVERLVHEGYLKSPAAISAFEIVPRNRFLPDAVRSNAYRDTPLPIGYRQTISAPHMVAMMVEALDLHVGQRVLEVGAGSGYHAAILAEMIAPVHATAPGHVYTLELVPELASFARDNLQAAGYGDATSVIHGDGSVGYEAEAPYDRILVTAAAPKVPTALPAQLKPGGILLLPVGRRYSYQDLLKISKGLDGSLVRESLGGVVFVPLRGEDGW